MGNLLKMERYRLLHNSFYWCGITCIFFMGLLTADTYLPEVMGAPGRAAASLADIFNGMVYDSTFLLILVSGILSSILGQEFSCRTIDLEISAGHSRISIFVSKVISYLGAFNLMALVYPVAGCMREVTRFGIDDPGALIYHIIKAVIYSFLLNSVTFLIAVLICYCLRSFSKALSVTAIITFAFSLYLGYGMMLDLPVSFLAIYQIRAAVTTTAFFQTPAVITGILWISGLLFFSWISFRKCDLK